MPHLVDHQAEVITAVVERARYIAVGQDPVAEDDVGIVFAPQGDYLLCIICNNQSDQQSAIQTCVSITRAVDAYFSA